MYSTSLLFRIVKAILVAGIGLLAFLIVVNNIVDYLTNFAFVEHVMKMDTIFPSSHIRNRSINSSIVYHVGYCFIILMEAAMCFCCLKGTLKLFMNVKNDAASFHASKNWAVAGITIGIVIWFLGFEVVGGEWFAMWQSTTWNGLAAAERILSFLMLTLILLHFKDE
jgi:predicted small integral membrane protein